ncbi:cyclodeaminase/cyclohydrolase family protein [Clostridium autoethanogenum]|uniref:Methenyltetrahydrofolate cyclohydrolase n=2 Tax=Clostridium autoethanogenum TaxID=84023 RepID=A0A3M0SVQ1_9CLOT|nr:cyclodeaminase/cyclohydrolase family protein [Clostridium autoethanogenum]AGY74463.1 cyclodeaminase/cyclohydrolase family protein [Clostridium autoethanogenum DSM 10061]ALU34651.1 Formiminotransferase-cyclodeaminase [Clostridium autoethanogenum DSM 10061]OVY51371.1 Methenyltetrahydrofolate cyclohydrolase [Clostridium autoethanogenum]RMD02460.1 methenyltetrahydrofolate cyclohydrolase [Clostridium autoethanogenum]
MLQDLKLKDFINELGSNSPAPGGGSIAALSASMASALASMVFNLTIGKKEYLEYDDSIKKNIDTSLEEVSLCKKDFLNFMEKDTDAFLSLMKAYKMPKKTEEEIKFRKEAIKKGNENAQNIPFEVAKSAYKLYSYIAIAVNYGNKNAISDAGVAASLTETAIEGALLNVKINIQGIKDEVYKKKMTDECSKLLKKSTDKKKEIMEIIEGKLK